MKFSCIAVAAVTISLLPSFASTEAFVPRSVSNLTPREKHFAPVKNLYGGGQQQHLAAASSSATLVEIPTSPIPGMKPGTSGLRKKVEVWQGIDDEIKQKYYVENFIQSLLDTAKANNKGEIPKTLIVAGDGRYFNDEAIQKICRVLAGNGVENIWVPRSGIMSTPAVSAVIRTREGGSADGGIILTASHNPGGPGEDFGIKYNEYYGQPAGEEFTDAVSIISPTVATRSSY
jgi:phosphoglucomutase